MSSNIKAGVVAVVRFAQPYTKDYNGYIDYIDRSEAVRNEHYCDYSMYTEYMADPEKTTSLFTEDRDSLGKEEKNALKAVFRTAQDKGSNMWQTVISFDNRWLEQQGLMDRQSMAVDERTLHEVTRAYMKTLLKAESMDHSVWSAAIHYNTDNMHIHIAFVEPVPSRAFMHNGELVQRGKFRQSSIDRAKSRAVNLIISRQLEHTRINDIMRGSIIGGDKNVFMKDIKLRKLFLDIHSKLPLNKRMWSYNMNAISHVRPQIDELSRRYIEKYHAADFKELKKLLDTVEDKYKTAYGDNSRGGYADNKLNDLYTRMGNSILKEMKRYDAAIKAPSQCGREMTPNNGYRREPDSHSLSGSLSALKRALHKDYDSFKNQIEYEKLEEKLNHDTEV